MTRMIVSILFFAALAAHGVAYAYGACGKQVADDRVVVGVDKAADAYREVAAGIRVIDAGLSKNVTKSRIGSSVKIHGKCLLSVRHVIRPNEHPSKPDPKNIDWDWTAAQFSNSDLNGAEVFVNLKWDGMTSKGYVKGKVIAAGMKEDVNSELIVIRVDGLPSNMPSFRISEKKPKDLVGKELVCAGYSADLFNGTPRVSISKGRVTKLDSWVIGTDSKKYRGGVQISCVGAGGASGGAVLAKGESGELELVGLQSVGLLRDEVFETSCGSGVGSEVQMMAMNTMLDESGVTIRKKIVELIDSGACD